VTKTVSECEFVLAINLVLVAKTLVKNLLPN